MMMRDYSLVHNSVIFPCQVLFLMSAELLLGFISLNICSLSTYPGMNSSSSWLTLSCTREKPLLAF